MAGDAVLAEINEVELLARRHDREQHVDVLELEEIVDHLAAEIRQRLGLGAGAVPDGEIVASFEKALGHGQSHAACTDPADLLLILRHRHSPSFVNCAVCSTRGTHLSSYPMRELARPHAEEHRSAIKS